MINGHGNLKWQTRTFPINHFVLSGSGSAFSQSHSSFCNSCCEKNKWLFIKPDEKCSAWTCWGSVVKFSNGSTSGRWRSYDCTNSLRTPTMKENQILREKNHLNMFKRCACLVSLTCIHTQQQTVWRRLLEVKTLPIDRWHDRTTRTNMYLRNRSRSRWNIEHFRQTARGCLIALAHCTALENPSYNATQGDRSNCAAGVRPTWITLKHWHTEIQ